MRLILVRHGESEWNAEGRIQGQASGNPLTAAGIAQASSAADSLVGCGATRLFSSDLTRARQTADTIASRLQLGVTEEPALREQAAGELEGRLAAELSLLPTPPGAHVNDVRWGGGESIADVHARLRGWLDRLLADIDVRTDPDADTGAGAGADTGAGADRTRRDGSVIVVSHGIALQVLRAVLAGRGPHDVTWDSLSNGEVLAVEFEPATWSGPN